MANQYSSAQDDYLIRVRFTAAIDPDRVDEWLKANFDDEFVEVVDRKTGDVVKSHGEDPMPFICPECGEEAYGIRTGANNKVYYHTAFEDCEVPS